MPRKALKSRRNFHFLITIPLFSIAIVFSLVIAFYFRVNNRIFSSTLSGYVQERSGSPVADATVCIESTCVQTDKRGLFVLQNISSGPNELSINSPQHENISQIISLTPGSNKIDMYVTPATVVSGKIIFKSNTDLNGNDLEVRLDQNEVQVDRNSEIKLDRIKTGSYSLDVKSEGFVDLSKEIIFEDNDDNVIIINLEPAAKAKIILTDWLSKKPIAGALVILNDSVRVTTNQQGEVFLDDIAAFSSDITVMKEGYIEKAIDTTKLRPREENILEVSITKDSLIPFIRNTNIGDQVFVVNADGKNEIQLTTKGDNSSPWIDADTELVYFRRKEKDNRKDTVFSISITGENLRQLTENSKTKIANNIDLLDYNSDRRVYLTKEKGKFILVSEQLSGAHIKDLLSLDEFNLKNLILSNNGKVLYFNQTPVDKKEGNIYSISTSLGLKSNIMDDMNNTAKAETVDSQNQSLLFTAKEKIMKFNMSTRILEELFSWDFTSKNFSFNPNSQDFAFLSKINDSEQALYFVANGQEPKKISPDGKFINDYKWIDKETLYILLGNTLEVIDIDTGNTKVVVDDVRAL